MRWDDPGAEKGTVSVLMGGKVCVGVGSLGTRSRGSFHLMAFNWSVKSEVMYFGEEDSVCKSEETKNIEISCCKEEE